MTSAIPVHRSTKLSYQANWELVIFLVRNNPVDDEDEDEVNDIKLRNKVLNVKKIYFTPDLVSR